MKHVALFCLGLQLSLLPMAEAAVAYRTLVLGANQTGDPAPGTSGKFGGGFKSAVINSAGTVVFQAEIAQTGQFGIWMKEPAGAPKLIAIEGGAATGVAGVKFTDLDFKMSLDRFGGVAFFAVTDQPAGNAKKQGVWLTDAKGAKPAPVAFTGVALPEEGATPSGIDTLVQAVNGRVGFNASFVHYFGTYWIYSPPNLDSEPRAGVFSGPRKTMKRSFWSETPTGVPNLKVADTNAFLGAWKLNALGEVAVEYTAVDPTFPGVPYGVGIASPQGPVQGRSEIDQTVSGAAAVVQLGSLKGFNDDSEVLFTGSVGATNAANPVPGLFSGPLLDLKIVMLSGNTAPGGPPGSTFDTETKPTFASAAQLAWHNRIKIPPATQGGQPDYGYGIWTGGVEQTPQAVAVGGNAAPGLPAGVKFSQVALLMGQEALFVNRQGVVAFIGGMEGVTGYDPFSRKGRALFAGKAGALEVIAHGGDPFEVAPGDTRTIDKISVVNVGLGSDAAIEGGGLSALNEANEIVFGLTFVEGGSGLFVAKLDLAKPANTPPRARDDVAGLRSGSATVAVLDNDSDIDGDKLTITAVSAPGFGTAKVSGKTISYKPGANFSGTDTFTYTIADGRGGSDIGTVAITGPFEDLSGSFTQLVTAGPDATRQTAVGLISVALSAKGMVSGKVTLRGTTYPLKGSANFDGSFDQVIQRKGTYDLSIHLEFTLDGQNRPLLTAHIGGDEPHYYNVATQPASLAALPPEIIAGSYTLLLAPDANASNPRGIGWATATVSATGSVKIAGRLADDTPFSAGSAIDGNRMIPVCALIATKPQGTLIGALKFEALMFSDFNGTLAWTKPPQTKSAGLFSGGFSATTAVRGALYTLTPDVPALTFTAPAAAKADLQICGAALPNLDAVVSVTPADKATVDLPNPGKVTVTITRKSGLLGGSFTPAGGKPIKFTGVLQQRQNSGGGYFPGAVQSGTVELVPR